VRSAAEDGRNGESLVDLEARSTPLTETSASEAMVVDGDLDVVVMTDRDGRRSTSLPDERNESSTQHHQQT
jgi:hypothetical protein